MALHVDTASPPLLVPPVVSLTKTLDIDAKDRQAGLFFQVPYTSKWLLLGVVIIFGLETGYQNALGEKGVIYIGGFWSWVSLACVLKEFFRLRRFGNYCIRATGGMIRHQLIFSAEGLEADVNGARTYLPWVFMSGFKVKNKTIVLGTATTSIYIRKKYFSLEELKFVEGLMKEKITYARSSN